MNWLALNGSPRGLESNTHVMLDMVRDGAGEGAHWDEVELRRTRDHAHVCEMLARADGVVLAYPLYTDSMPGIVVAFLETLATDEAVVDAVRSRETPILFLVHSGFPEGIHTKHLEVVHRRVCERLGLRHLGTVRKPGSEGVRFMPPFMLRPVARTLGRVGEALTAGEDVAVARPERLVAFERFGLLRRAMVRLGMALGTINVYWYSMLRSHDAWERRFDAPYGEPLP